MSARRIFLTFLTWVYLFPRATKKFVISVNLVNISTMVSFSFILKSSNLWKRTEILDSFTLFVSSCVTCKIYHIWFADLVADTRLNSFCSRHKKAHSFLWRQDLQTSFVLHSMHCNLWLAWCTMLLLCSRVHS